MSPLLSWSGGGHPAFKNSMCYQCRSRRGDKIRRGHLRSGAPSKTKGRPIREAMSGEAPPPPAIEWEPGVYRFVDASCSSDPDCALIKCEAGFRRKRSSCTQLPPGNNAQRPNAEKPYWWLLTGRGTGLVAVRWSRTVAFAVSYVPLGGGRFAASPV